MSLYNMLFGVNPFSDALLGLLGTKADSIPRYRDCFVDEKGRIVIHTRTGGGNREFYESEASCRDHHPEYFGGEAEEPNGPWNCDLRELPGFLYDEDDDYDCTYANFIYQPAAIHTAMIETLKTLGAEGNPAERWQSLMRDMEDGDKSKPEVQNALKVGEMIMGRINEIQSKDLPA